MIWDFPYSCRNNLANHRAPYLACVDRDIYRYIFRFCRVQWKPYRDPSVLFIAPFCLFCYHCSVSLYFAKYNCTFRSSVLFSFALLQLFLQFIGEFLLMCRVCCEMQKMSKLPTVYPRITLRVGFISWINFLYSWQVTGPRGPPENLHGYPGAWNTRNWLP